MKEFLITGQVITLVNSTRRFFSAPEREKREKEGKRWNITIKK